MSIYEIIGKSGIIYIGKLEGLEKKIILYQLLKKSFEISDCVTIHPILGKDTYMGGYLFDHPKELLKAYKETDKNFKKNQKILATAIESYLKLE